jgi:hypothetical protein
VATKTESGGGIVMKYRVVQERDFGQSGLWYAEEKTTFGWERVLFTYAESEETANWLLNKERPESCAI